MRRLTIFGILFALAAIGALQTAIASPKRVGIIVSLPQDARNNLTTGYIWDAGVDGGVAGWNRPDGGYDGGTGPFTLGSPSAQLVQCTGAAHLAVGWASDAGATTSDFYVAAHEAKAISLTKDQVAGKYETVIAVIPDAPDAGTACSVFTETTNK